MKKRGLKTLGGLLAIAGATTLSSPSWATLHGFCSSTAPCPEIGGLTETSVNPPVFGFASSPPGETGNVMIDILVPDIPSPPASATYTFSGPASSPTTFTASLVSSTTPFTSGDLAAYLGLPPGTTPANPFGGFGFGGVTGYFVYAADAGTVTLPGASEENTPAGDSFLYTLDQGLPGTLHCRLPKPGYRHRA